MSPGASPSGPTPAKLGGVTLIGVGLLAGVVGVGTFVSGAPSTDAASPPKQVSPSAPPSDSAPPEQSPSKPPSQDPPLSRPSEPKPPESDSDESGQQTGGQQTGDQKPPADQENRVMVRVYNNSKIAHLAERAANDFRGVGYVVPEVGNYSAGRIYTTTVYFRPGTGERAQAEQVAQRIGARLEPRFPGLEQASPGVIAIITNDYSGINGK